MIKVGDKTLVAGGGELSDLQAIEETLKDLQNFDFRMDDGITKNAIEYHSYLTRIFYNRRCKMDPFWNALVVAGFCSPNRDDAEAPESGYLGYTDLHGTNFVDNYICTGLGAHLALPLLRKNYRPDLSKEEAKGILADCMRVLFYRDCRTINKIQFAVCTSEGVEISAPVKLKTRWVTEFTM